MEYKNLLNGFRTEPAFFEELIVVVVAENNEKVDIQ